MIRASSAGLRNPLTVTRYHSLIVETLAAAADLEVTAWSLPDERNLVSEIMGVRHRQLPIVGVQFHPESIQRTGNGTAGQFCGVTMIGDDASSISRSDLLRQPGWVAMLMLFGGAWGVPGWRNS